MSATLSCTISKIATIPNKVNADMIAEYLEYMRDNGASERHQNNALKAVIGYAKFLVEKTTFYDINTKEQISACSPLGPPQPKSLKLTTTEPTFMIGSNPTELTF